VAPVSYTHLHRTAGLLRGDARLVEGRGIDQVAHAFRLRQVDPAIQIRAQRELARLGEARARVHRQRDGMPQHHWRAMARNLHYLFGCVRTRAREKCDYDLIHRLPLRVQQLGQLTGPRLPIGRSRKADHPCGDLARPPAGKAHYAEPTASGRRGNSNDGVGEVQLPPGCATDTAALRTAISVGAAAISSGVPPFSAKRSVAPGKSLSLIHI